MHIGYIYCTNSDIMMQSIVYIARFCTNSFIQLFNCMYLWLFGCCSETLWLQQADTYLAAIGAAGPSHRRAAGFFFSLSLLNSASLCILLCLYCTYFLFIIQISPVAVVFSFWSQQISSMHIGFSLSPSFFPFCLFNLLAILNPYFLFDLLHLCPVFFLTSFSYSLLSCLCFWCFI